MESAIERIRRDTSDLHKKLEMSPLARDLMSREISIVRYTEILLQWSAAWASIEDCLEQAEFGEEVRGLIPSKKSHYAKHDIDFISKKFELDEYILSELSPKVKVRINPISTKFTLAGYCYVMKGASLGGQLISRHLSNYLALERGAGASFFHPLDTDRPTWSEWRHTFNRVIKNQQEYLSALSGAQFLFRTLTNAFTLEAINRGK
jgi:heme oxygenase